MVIVIVAMKQRKPRAPKAWPRSPLGEHLDETEIDQVEFATELSRVRGYRIYQSQVSAWATGEKIPNRALRPAIEEATAGIVRVEEWDTYAKKKARCLRASEATPRATRTG